MGYQFYADPAAIERLGKQFDKASADLHSRISQFVGRADEIGDAFGVLTESHEATQAYNETLGDMVEALRKLRDHLERVGQALPANARTYTGSDAGNAQRFGGGS